MKCLADDRETFALLRQSRGDEIAERRAQAASLNHENFLAQILPADAIPYQQLVIDREGYKNPLGPDQA